MHALHTLSLSTPCMSTILVFMAMHSVGASVSARDHRKQTPLHVAAEGGDEEVIALLLDKNADSHLPDIDGNTPLDLAAKERFESAVNLLSMHTCSSKKDDAVKKTLETAMGSERVKDDLVKEKIGVMSPDRYEYTYGYDLQG